MTEDKASQDKIKQLKAHLPSIPEQIQLIQKGDTNEFFSPYCPFCGTGNDRFNYFADKQRYWCRSCGKSGDRIDVYMQEQGTTYAELFRQYGITDNGDRNKSPTAEKTPPPPPPQKEMPVRNETPYTPQQRWDDIWKHSIIMSPLYSLLTERRKIDETVVKRTFSEGKIGYKDHGLKGHDKLLSVACQYAELDGEKRVLAIQFLSVLEEMYSSDGKNKVFAAGSDAKGDCFFWVGVDIDKAKTVVLCEGVYNAMSCVQCLPNDVCVLALGSSTYSGKLDSLKKHISGKAIVCFFDNDPSGQEITQKARQALGEGVKSVQWPDGTPAGHDVNDLLKAGRGEVIVEMVAGAVPVGIEVSPVEELNKVHAVVTVGEKVKILHETTNIKGKPEIRFLSLYDFKVLYLNRKVPNPFTGNPGQPKQIFLADAWLGSANRRQYDGVAFEPQISNNNFYNLYNGFMCEPVAGNWSLFKAHIYENICSSNLEHFEWLLAWMARIVQDPGGTKPGTAIVLRGLKGVGKGVFAEIFGEIFGQHFQIVTHAQQATGRFNSVLKDCLLLYLDEAFYAGDKSAEGVLKGLITSNIQNIEMKGKDVFKVGNHVNCIIASNNDWIVSVSSNERRYFVLDVEKKHIQDHGYFGAISKQMYENGGVAAMLYELMAIDLSRYNLREAPKTKGLIDQLLLNLSTFEKFWFDLLLSNFDFNEDNGIQAMSLYDRYIAYCVKLNTKFRDTSAIFGKNLVKISNVKTKKRRTPNGKKSTFYFFEGRKKCRNLFEKQMGMKIPWKTARKSSIENAVDEI